MDSFLVPGLVPSGCGRTAGLIFAQQIALHGQLLSLFTLSRLGLNAAGNAVIFVFVGILVVSVQGGFIDRGARKSATGA